MELKSQVTSLELSKRLKELGVKQESIFWWSERYLLDNPDQKSIDVRFMMNPDLNGTAYSYHHEKDLVSAFTVAELGEMLNATHPSVFVSYREIFDKTRLWICISRTDVEGMIERNEYQIATTEADARAKILIYLLENNLITLPS